MNNSLFFAFLLISSFLLISCENKYGDLVIKSANRLIDLDSQFARHFLNLTFENTGSSPISTFYFAVHEEKVQNLIFIAVANPANNETFQVYGPPTEVSEKRAIYKITFKNTVAEAGSTISFEVYFAFSHVQKPLPTRIKQNERQFVRYEDHAYIFSPYLVKTQATQFKLASSNVEGFSERPPTQNKDNIVVYGPYTDIAPFSRARIHVHFENNKPFVTVTNFVRELEVSHWGNLAVEETLNFQHDGAKHDGAWSRWEYQKSNFQNTPLPVIASLTEILPAGASDIYYRDEIGNISTSQYYGSSEAVSFVFKPRFPLYGGWKSAHYHGFNLPLNQFLSTDSSVYVLNFTLVPVLLESVIDHLTVRVILPEGATNIKIHTPFPVENEARSLHFTYLDTIGRPVVSFEVKNVIAELKGQFQVTYTFSQSSLLREPFLLISGYFTLLFLFIIYLRIDLNLTAKDDRVERASELLIRYKEEFYDVYSGVFASLDKALKQFTTKELTDKDFRTIRTQQEKVIDKANDAFKAIVSELEEVNTSITNRVNELKKHLTDKIKHQKVLHDNELASDGSKSTAYTKAKAEASRQFELSDEEAERIYNDLFEKSSN